MEPGPDPQDEERLASRFREGDPEALEALLEDCRGDLQRAAERGLPPHLRRRVSVSDIVQETRIAAYEARGGFEYRGGGSFRRWVLGIAGKKVLQALRHHLGTGKRSARREARGADAPSVGDLPSPGPSPSQVAMGEELEGLARRALESLPDDQREILRLTRDERLTVAEAGNRMNLPAGTAKRLYGRALVRFRGAFERLRGKGHG